MKPLLFGALDVPTSAAAMELVKRAGSQLTHVKVGLELYVAEGPAVVRAMQAEGKEVLLDLKLHDIPETVERAARRIGELGVGYTTVHVAGGPKMLEAAVKGLAGWSGAKVLGVTVLTSMDERDLDAVGTVVGSVESLVVKRAILAYQSGCHGVIASPKEVAAIREATSPDFLIITPGVRPAGADHGDQKRVGTAVGTIAAGGNGVVVGRPIRDADDPAKVVDALIKEMAAARPASGSHA